MKRNLLSILILALLIINLVLTAIMMFSVTSTTKKSAALVDSIASALQLELSDPSASGASGGISLADTEMYNFADTMTIQLRPGEDGQSHYFVTGVSLSINKSSDGYKQYGGEAMASWDQLMQGQISTIIGGYTYEQAQVDQESMRAAIVSALQTMFESDIIYNVTFVNPLIQ